ncbi:MAG TPA: tripartite tricarboxylate transporter TctB family protein [Rectinemataceae bacterium]|nr:tripartite tricarboxylate transporter TctB family protein [Rectinemataceae bacterium]
MTDSQMRKADFLSAIVLMALGAVFVAVALGMPPYKQGWYAAPGFTPLVFGSILGFMGLILFARTLIKGGWAFRLNADHWRRVRDSKAVRRVSVMCAFIFAFLFLFDKVPFLLLSSAFLFGTIWYFKGAKLWVNAVVSVVATTIVWYIFGVIFMIPLP